MEKIKKVSELKKTSKNPRKNVKFEELRKNMQKFGDLGGIVFNRKLGELVTGNQRTEILKNGEIKLKELKEARKDGTVAEGIVVFDGMEFKYREVDWDIEKHREGVLIANTHAGVWDKKELKSNWGDLPLVDWGILEGSFKKVEDGEIVFSAELDEASNYVVLKFDKDIDWLQFLSLVGLEKTYSIRANGKPWSKGVGRVVDGKSLINKITNFK